SSSALRAVAPFFLSSRRRHTSSKRDWSSDVCSSDLLYSEGIEDIGGLDEGAEIAVPNDPANLSRALRILEEEGLVEIDPEAGENATENDIVENPQDLTVTPLEAPQIPRSLSDVDAAVVNGNYAIEADLAEEANILAWEPE